jgi:hypothetical protein
MWFWVAILLAAGLTLLVAAIIMNYITMYTQQYDTTTSMLSQNNTSAIASITTAKGLSRKAPAFKAVNEQIQGSFRFVRQSMPFDGRDLVRRCMGNSLGVLHSGLYRGDHTVHVTDIPANDDAGRIAASTWSIVAAKACNGTLAVHIVQQGQSFIKYYIGYSTQAYDTSVFVCTGSNANRSICWTVEKDPSHPAYVRLVASDRANSGIASVYLRWDTFCSEGVELSPPDIGQASQLEWRMDALS